MLNSTLAAFLLYQTGRLGFGPEPVDNGICDAAFQAVSKLSSFALAKPVTTLWEREHRLLVSSLHQDDDRSAFAAAVTGCRDEAPFLRSVDTAEYHEEHEGQFVLTLLRHFPFNEQFTAGHGQCSVSSLLDAEKKNPNYAKAFDRIAMLSGNSRATRPTIDDSKLDLSWFLESVLIGAETRKDDDELAWIDRVGRQLTFSSLVRAQYDVYRFDEGRQTPFLPEYGVHILGLAGRIAGSTRASPALRAVSREFLNAHLGPYVERMHARRTLPMEYRLATVGHVLEYVANLGDDAALGAVSFRGKPTQLFRQDIDELLRFVNEQPVPNDWIFIAHALVGLTAMKKAFCDR